MSRTKVMTHSARLEHNGLSHRKIVNRLCRLYSAATPETVSAGLAWYGDALDYAISLTDEFGADIETAASVIAALSPQLYWGPNKVAARLAFMGERKSGILGESYERARRVMCAVDPVDSLLGKNREAFKIHNFARNILGDYDAVTIDVWAVRAATGPGIDGEKLLKRVGVYAALADAYSVAARRVGISPAALQAVIWVHVRGRAD